MASRCAVCGENGRRNKVIRGWSGEQRTSCEKAGLVSYLDNQCIHRNCRQKVILQLTKAKKEEKKQVGPYMPVIRPRHALQHIRFY